MSLRVPLGVRLTTSKTYRDITNEVDDLVIRWTDPGGYASCQIALDRPLVTQPADIAYYGGLTVYDTRNGAVAFDGRQEDPGRSAGDGQVWDLVAVGGQAHTLDRTLPLVYVDRRMTQDVWTPATAPLARHIDISYPSDDTPAIRLHARSGSTFTVNTSTWVAYRAIQLAGQKLARVSCAWTTGSVSSNNIARIDTRTAAGAQTTVESDPLSVTTGTLVGSLGGANAIPAGDDVAFLVLIRITSNLSVTGDDIWLEFANLAVRAQLKTKAGVDITSGYSADTVLASEVVADLLGTWLTQYDGANATIDTTSYAIDQLAYPDGATPRKVLDDLMELERGYTWRVWERNSAGKYRFEWTAVPTTVRYEADVSDGYDSQGSADGLYNRVTVRWRAAAGVVRSLVRTTTVPILDAAGLIRQGLLDLGDEIGSTAAATQAGDQWLVDRANPPNAGRLRIARPILDLQTGRMVMPWEIRPGLIRVRGIQPRIDALNATSRDGVTVFRIVASEFRASDGAATLELDSYAPSTARILADLSRRPVFRRR